MCKKFQYNEWELNLKEIWERASHRVLTLKLSEKIQNISSRVSYSMLSGNKEPEIIAIHKKMIQEC